jgi:hypothetical protein
VDDVSRIGAGGEGRKERGVQGRKQSGVFFDEDGLTDLVVVNDRSESISVLFVPRMNGKHVKHGNHG